MTPYINAARNSITHLIDELQHKMKANVKVAVVTYDDVIEKEKTKYGLDWVKKPGFPNHPNRFQILPFNSDPRKIENFIGDLQTMYE